MNLQQDPRFKALVAQNRFAAGGPVDPPKNPFHPILQTKEWEKFNLELENASRDALGIQRKAGPVVQREQIQYKPEDSRPLSSTEIAARTGKVVPPVSSLSLRDFVGSNERGEKGLQPLPPILPQLVVGGGAAKLASRVIPKGLSLMGQALNPASYLPYLTGHGAATSVAAHAGMLGSAALDGYFISQVPKNIKDGDYTSAVLNSLGAVPYVKPVVKGTADAAVDAAQFLHETYGPQAWRTVFYNNITPSYYDLNMSWHPKGKLKGEFPAALKDYLSGKGTKLNPKWKDMMLSNPLYWSGFPNGYDTKLHTDLRDEAYKIYQQIPHEYKYIVPTGKVDAAGNPIYTLNKKEIPIENFQEFVNIYGGEKNGSFVGGDPANFGGNVQITKKSNGDTFEFTIDDVFDVQPFKDPDRIVESLPSPLRKAMFKQITDPTRSEFKFIFEPRKWFKPFTDFEIGTITGGKPFRSTTSFGGKLLPASAYELSITPEQIPLYREKIIKEKLKIELYSKLKKLKGIAQKEHWTKAKWDEEINRIKNELEPKIREKVNKHSDATISDIADIETELDYAKKTGTLNFSSDLFGKGQVIY